VVPDIGFFAYPGGRQAVREAVLGAEALSADGPMTLKPWESMRVIGFKIDDLVRETIIEAAVLFADITYPNPNVMYEMGFAIAKDKPAIPTLNISIDRASQSVQTVGLFDSIGLRAICQCR
jgi:nucleoside 2-deoxyribosyltransferase